MAAQRERIEQLYLGRRVWDLATWEERYLNHPIVGTLARRLIWCFEAEGRQSTGIWWDNRVVTLENEQLDWLDATTQVSLWHPIVAAQETVLGWRQWLVRHEVQQPFKQAHRELYRLTTAEEETEIYSNRYAAHILKQYPFNALCATRGWRNSLRYASDSDVSPPATRPIPAWNIRAEFWLDSAGEEVSDNGIYLYLKTDQVRFYPLDVPKHDISTGDYHFDYDAENSIPLAQIEPVVFSEIMRDGDLFVGVCSIGADPEWVDAGREERMTHYEGVERNNFVDYWYSYSLEQLSEGAKARREYLKELLPKLKIAEQCEITERYLVVRGSLGTYKIHLGSGNVLMEPDDAFVCIVAKQAKFGRNAVDKLFLPFAEMSDFP